MVYNCLHCGKLNNKSGTKNKFCDNVCAITYKRTNSVIPRILAGEVSEPKTLKRYLKEVFGDVCSSCGTLPMWNNKPLSLQIEHKDGNSDNNLPDNLCLLCPNCHSQTETFAGKVKGKKSTKRNSYLREYKGYNSQVV